MWQKTPGLVGCALAVLACGAAPPAPPKPAVAPVASAPAPVSREASADLRRYWIFDGKDGLALYGGLDALLRTELFAGLVPGVLGQSEEFLKGKQRDCITVLAAQAREAAVGVDGRGGLLILELGPEGVTAARSACVGALFPVERVAVAGADEAYAAGKDVVVVQAGVVLFGSKALVQAALAASKVPFTFPATLSLKGEQHLAFQVRVPEQGISGNGALRVSPEAFHLEAEVDLTNAGMADTVERGIQQTLGQAKQLEQDQPDLAKLIKALDVQRRGNHFKAVFELREPVLDQARDLGVLMGLGFYATRRYLQRAKSAEAHDVIGQIAKGYAVTLQEPPPAGKRARPSKLVSLPAVPATVPRGVKYQSSADDWKAWAPIHFALTEPQYYQYEVVAAKDGKTAEILARGDLDGDGKTSLFRIKIQLDPKAAELTAIDHTEEEPLE